jgi:serine/threonine protein kinase
MPVSESVTIQFTDATVLSPGKDFGARYRIEALLGEGGMGRVYKAYDKTLDRMVAIKVVRQGVMGDAETLKRFKQELLLASKISHKNILRIHDMGDVRRPTQSSRSVKLQLSTPPGSSFPVGSGLIHVIPRDSSELKKHSPGVFPWACTTVTRKTFEVQLKGPTISAPGITNSRE